MDLFNEILFTSSQHIDNLAIIHEDEFLMYNDLFKKANNFAQFFIKEAHISGNFICGIISYSSIQAISCAIGILQAGGCYFFIEPETPNERILSILSNIEPTFIFVDDSSNRIASLKNINTINLNYIYNRDFNGEFIKCFRNSKDIAYIVFTSGSTGKPKAIMVEDTNILCYIKSYIYYFKITEKDRLLQQSPVYYDGFAEEVFVSMLTGSTLILTDKKNLKNPRLIQKILKEYNISIYPVTPLILSLLNDMEYNTPSVRAFISSGDVLAYSQINNIMKYAEVYNMYGPTETTVCATVFKCQQGEKGYVPIGRPLNAYKLTLLNEHLNEVQQGEVGEIYISGEGVTRGYYKDYENTAMSFITIDDTRMYKTGDFAFRDSYEILHFQGRQDRQLKIRGNRIELSEIEQCIESFPEIKKAVVIPLNNENITMTVFYVGENIDESELKRYCNEMLLDYMIPHFYINIAEIPITDTGKVDIVQLKKNINNYQINTNSSEFKDINILEKILSIISKTLDRTLINNITYDSNLTDIGIDSISFIKIIINIEDALKVNFDDNWLDITKYQTIGELSSYVNQLLINK